MYNSGIFYTHIYFYFLQILLIYKYYAYNGGRIYHDVKKNINLYRQDGKIFPIKVVEPVFKPFVYAYAIRDVQITFFYLALPRTRRTIYQYIHLVQYICIRRGAV